jgi:hypothetical protein
MADQYRTTVSMVFWAADPEAAQATVDELKAGLPAEDQDATLSTIEYHAEGRPAPPPEPTAADLAMDGGTA